MSNLNDFKTSAQLEKLFINFNEASQRLEGRYETLLAETENLRRQLREKEEEIKRGERLVALGETAAAIAHEIRNPLGSIKLFISLLRQEVFNNASAKEYVDQIETSMLRLDAVITNILHFSKDKLPTFTLVNMNALITDLCDQFVSNNNGQVNIKKSLNANPFIYGNDAAIRQILNNLFNNAKQASVDECRIIITTNDSDESLDLQVNNYGPAIPDDLIERMFEPFVSNKVSGTGLGLAIVRRLVQQHNGSVKVENNTIGPKFQIILPRAQARK